MSDPPATGWTAFCDELHRTLLELGTGVVADSATPLDRDEGLRMVLRQLQHCLERDFEERDVAHPVFGAVFTDTYHTLADAPDYAAYDASISGRYTYRLTGRLGSADSINLITVAPRTVAAEQLTNGVPWSPWADAGKPSAGKVVTGALDLADLDPNSDGRFELVVSTQRPDAGVWLPMSEETDRLVVRNVFQGPYRQHRRYHPAHLWIERVDDTSAPSAYSTDELRSGLAAVLRGVARIPAGRAGIFDRIRSAGKVGFSDDDTFWRVSGSNPRTRFQEGYWAIAQDEALVIELDRVPDCSSWSLGLTNAWMESLDFRFFPINLNSTSAQVGADGSLRIVIAHRNPGVENWLDVAGHDHGAMLWRWNDVEAMPALPRVTRVHLTTLAR
jgi:hypothetical protein